MSRSRTNGDLIDPDTPQSAHNRLGFDGKTYQLVFSDEFNKAQRTFKSGDDPFWEAVDLFDSKSVDLQWYETGQSLPPFFTPPPSFALSLIVMLRPGYDEEWQPCHHPRQRGVQRDAVQIRHAPELEQVLLLLRVHRNLRATPRIFDVVWFCEWSITPSGYIPSTC